MQKSATARSLIFHEKNRGKLEIRSKVPLRNRHDLALAYTPGVADVSKAIAKNPLLAYKYTIKANTVAIVTDGSAVLGLGNLGGYAAIPVMEGKAILFKKMAGIDAFPIVFQDYHTDFVEDVKNIAPVFGGINLEDIAAPMCFEVEQALQGIGIPVMHDDQWGTAVAVLAGLLNALKVSRRNMTETSIVVLGAGAAGLAVTRLLHLYGAMREEPAKDIIVCDSKGIVHRDRSDMNAYKNGIATITNRHGTKGGLEQALRGADVVIGVSVGGALRPRMLAAMNPGPIVFALANPAPEIMPAEAYKAGASIVATGRSDFPNQINNLLAFPGIFRGALDSYALSINDQMKIAAALAIAGCVKGISRKRIVPGTLDKSVTRRVAEAVARAARESGCSRTIS